MDLKLYIWQREDWPNFTWDSEKLISPIYETTKQVSNFLGRVGALDRGLQEATTLDTFEDEIIASSSIEGVLLDRDSVRSSLLARLGVDFESEKKIGKSTEGAVSIVLDAVNYHDSPLTKDRLFAWHSQLFPDGVSEGHRIITGAWRQGPIYVVSGHMGMEIIHFEAPPAHVVDEEIDRFLEFVNESDVNPLIKAAIAHLWFVTIHPFADGNGRTARAITEFLLAKADGSKHRYYSLSSAILADRKSYYDAIEWAERGTMDATSFIVYFLGTLRHAVDTAVSKLDKTLEKTRYWDSVRALPLNDRQMKMVNMLLEGFNGKLTAEKWAKITKCSHSTALRDINGLIGMGVLVDDGGRTRNTGYLLKAMEYAKDS